jgi:hypothetical protein
MLRQHEYDCVHGDQANWVEEVYISQFGKAKLHIISQLYDCKRVCSNGSI